MLLGEGMKEIHSSMFRFQFSRDNTAAQHPALFFYWDTAYIDKHRRYSARRVVSVKQ